MIYDYEVISGKGETVKLSDFKGKVILIVNTATGCGFTPQYAPIEKLYFRLIIYSNHTRSLLRLLCR